MKTYWVVMLHYANAYSHVYKVFKIKEYAEIAMRAIAKYTDDKITCVWVEAVEMEDI